MSVGRLLATEDLDGLDFDKSGGTVTVVVQNAETRDVLMVAAADREALVLTLTTGEMHFRSRTRGLWRKGSTSGNVLRVLALYADCDGDAVVALVQPRGPTCHSGATSCFGDAALAEPSALVALDATVGRRAQGDAPGTSYTARLLGDRNLRLKKLGEECAELVTACADDDRARAVSEAADLIYHIVVAVHGVGGTLSDVERVLAARQS